MNYTVCNLVLLFSVGLSFGLQARQLAEPHLDSLAQPSPRSVVKNKEVHEIYLAREIFKSSKENVPNDPKSLLSTLENGDWFCSPTENTAETGPVLVAQKLTDNDIKENFVEHLNASETKIMSTYHKTLDDAEALGKDFPLQFLSQARANGHLFHPLGILGYRVLALEPGYWLSEEDKSIASFFAENILENSSNLSDKMKADLQAQCNQENKKNRIPALIRLALSEEPKTQELYSQIVLSLSQSQIDELKKFIEKHGVGDDSPSACTLLRLPELLTKSPDLEKAIKIPELSQVALRRGLQQNPSALAEAIKDHPELGGVLLPHLFQMRDKKERALPKILESLSPRSKELYDRLSPLIPETKPQEDSTFAPKPEEISRARTTEIDTKTITGLIDAMGNPSWQCSDEEFISPRKAAQETLLSNKELRNKFIETQKELSQKNFLNLVSQYKQGEWSDLEFMSRLHDFEAKFYVTEEASKKQAASYPT